jgi:hypothetical protein
MLFAEDLPLLKLDAIIGTIRSGAARQIPFPTWLFDLKADPA